MPGMGLWHILGTTNASVKRS